MANIDIAAINNTANDMKPELRELVLYTILNTFSNLTKVPGSIKTDVKLDEFSLGDVFGSYTESIVARMAANQLGEFKRRVLTVRQGLAVISQSKVKMLDTYIAEMEDYTLTTEKPPLADWMLIRFVKAALRNMKDLPWRGIFNSGGANPMDVADGYLKIITDEITAGNISTANGNLYTTTAGAAYTENNIGTELYAQWLKLSPETRSAGAVMYVPFHLQEMYKEWILNTYSNISSGDFAVNTLDKTNGKCKLIWEDAMGTVSRVVVTTNDNLMYGLNSATGSLGDVRAFEPEANPLLIGLIAANHIGFQIFSIDKAVFVVNQLT